MINKNQKNLNLDNQKQKYFLKNNILYSQKSFNFDLPITIKDIKILENSKDYLLNNKILIENLNDLFEKNKKKIKLNQKIENFQLIKKQILKNKLKQEKPKQNDYIFIENTSQIEIIQRILLEYENLDILKIEQKIKNYIKKNLIFEQEKLFDFNKKNQILQNQLKDLNSKIKNQTNQILILNNKKQFLLKKTQKIEKQKNKINQENYYEKINNYFENKTQKLKEKLIFIKNLKKENLQILKQKYFLGKRKNMNWLIFIITLGLIYWTKYSNLKYQINKKKLEIQNLNSKILILENKQKTQKKTIFFKIINYFLKIKKNKNYKIEQKEEILKNKQKEIENKLKKTQKKLENENQKQEKILEKISELNSKIKYTKKFGFEKISIILENQISDDKTIIKNLKNLKKEIISQKIEIDGELIFTQKD